MGPAAPTQETRQRRLSEYVRSGEFNLGKRRLYELYWNEEMHTREIASSVNMSPSTIRRWMDQFGIPTRGSGMSSVDTFIFGMRPREWLESEYYDKGKNPSEIANENNVSRGTVENVFRRHDPPIEMKSPEYFTGYKKHTSKKLPSITWKGGYRVWNVGLGDRVKVPEHRVTAVGEWGLDAIKGKHVHHANGIKWLNAPEFDMDIPELENPNLRPMDPISHHRL